MRQSTEKSTAGTPDTNLFGTPAVVSTLGQRDFILVSLCTGVLFVVVVVVVVLEEEV